MKTEPAKPVNGTLGWLIRFVVDLRLNLHSKFTCSHSGLLVVIQVCIFFWSELEIAEVTVTNLERSELIYGTKSNLS